MDGELFIVTQGKNGCFSEKASFVSGPMIDHLC